MVIRCVKVVRAHTRSHAAFLKGKSSRPEIRNSMRLTGLLPMEKSENEGYRGRKIRQVKHINMQLRAVNTRPPTPSPCDNCTQTSRKRTITRIPLLRIRRLHNAPPKEIANKPKPILAPPQLGRKQLVLIRSFNLPLANRLDRRIMRRAHGTLRVFADCVQTPLVERVFT